MTNPQYIKAQLARVVDPAAPAGNSGLVRVKFHSERGQTNWLNIDPNKWGELHALLTRESK